MTLLLLCLAALTNAAPAESRHARHLGPDLEMNKITNFREARAKKQARGIKKLAGLLKRAKAAKQLRATASELLGDESAKALLAAAPDKAEGWPRRRLPPEEDDRTQ